jgi:hypothetical protein
MQAFQLGIAEEDTGEVRVDDAHRKLSDAFSDFFGIGFDPKRRQTR